jgi:hypothetical protein
MDVRLYTGLWTLDLLFVQVLEVVHGLYTCCLFKCLRSSMDVRLYTGLWNLHLLFVQVLEVVHGLYTCCLFKCLKSSMDFTLVVCSSA